MPIETLEELEQALADYHAVAEASDDSPDGRRRRELEGEIDHWYLTHPDTLRPAKPEGSVA
jgi:hypothetical protein